MRRAKRIPAVMPVRLASAGKGVTRDISASGIFFATESEYMPGKSIYMTIDFMTPAGKLHYICQGVIVRVEQSGARVGVAVKISDSLLRYGKN